MDYSNGGFIAGMFFMMVAYMLCCCSCLVHYFIRKGHRMLQGEQPTEWQPTELVEFNVDVDDGNNNRPNRNDSLRVKLVNKFTAGFKGTFGKADSRKMLSRLSAIELKCSICYEEYGCKAEDVLIGQLKKCDHFFHFDCIWEWLEQQGTCPLCRSSVTLTESDIRGLALDHVIGINRTQEAQNYGFETDKRSSSSSTMVTISET